MSIVKPEKKGKTGNYESFDRLFTAGLYCSVSSRSPELVDFAIFAENWLKG